MDIYGLSNKYLIYGQRQYDIYIINIPNFVAAVISKGASLST